MYYDIQYNGYQCNRYCKYGNDGIRVFSFHCQLSVTVGNTMVSFRFKFTDQTVKFPVKVLIVCIKAVHLNR